MIPTGDDRGREEEGLQDEQQSDERQDQDVSREHVREETDLSEISRMNWPRISSGTISDQQSASAPRGSSS